MTELMERGRTDGEAENRKHEGRVQEHLLCGTGKTVVEEQPAIEDRDRDEQPHDDGWFEKRRRQPRRRVDKPGRYDAGAKTKAEDRSIRRSSWCGLPCCGDETGRLQLVLDQKGDVLGRELPRQLRADANANLLEGPLAINLL